MLVKRMTVRQTVRTNGKADDRTDGKTDNLTMNEMEVLTAGRIGIKYENRQATGKCFKAFGFEAD